jgi:hypothetical protein
MGKREDELRRQGWEKRFTASEPKLSEAVELYRSIGFDVLLEPLPDGEESDKTECAASGCTACFEVEKERYRIVFTRKEKGESYD